jgi:hypothetical protein
VVGLSYGGVRGLVIAASVHLCSAIAPGVYADEVKFAIEKLDVVCVYPYPNMLVIVYCGPNMLVIFYCGTPKVGTEPSMVVRL